nr:hypothetical protein [Moraxella sp. CTOTU48268]
MREHDYNKLLAEKNTLIHLIENSSGDDFIGQMSLKSRLNSIENVLSSIDPVHLIKKAVITFRGKPVHESHGITAEFSGKAIDSLNNMVASVVASLNNNLKHHGPIPDREQHQLMITGTAVGSFGFEFELPPPNFDLLAERNTSENAIVDIQMLLELAINGNDEEISDIVDTIHPRAVKKVTEFLELMKSYNALFALQFNNRQLRIHNDEQLTRLIERLSNDNIVEKEETYTGEFQGVLPNSRTFEFKTIGDGEVIRGKLEPTFESPEILNNEYLNRPITVKLNTITFGQAKPKYRLSDINHIHD